MKVGICSDQWMVLPYYGMLKRLMQAGLCRDVTQETLCSRQQPVTLTKVYISGHVVVATLTVYMACLTLFGTGIHAPGLSFIIYLHKPATSTNCDCAMHHYYLSV